MNTPLPSSSKTTHHPMMIIAAIAVILFCLAGTAAIMGWIPSSIGGASSSGELTASDRAALASRLADSDRLGIEPAGNVAVYQRVVDIEIDAEALGHELWDLIDAAEQFRQGLGHD
ncbi:MAG: hypothetical protein Q8Q82_09460 [Hydrogenophaga sp.]|nr:hypothetical protein [Hydrogenophaga sp.]